jgi:hypothetical protein
MAESRATIGAEPGADPADAFVLEGEEDPAAVFECVPVACSGNCTINGNEINLECGDQWIEIEWFVRDWDLDQDGTPKVNGYQTRQSCDDYYFDMAGIMVPESFNMTPGPIDPFKVGIDTYHPDYIFPYPIVAVGDC